MRKLSKASQVLMAAALLLVPAAGASATPLAATNDACTGIKVDNTTDVNLRSKASATSKIVGVVAKGTTMTVLDCSGGANWWHISMGGISGFVSSRYTVELGNMDVTTLPQPVPAPEPTCQGNIVTTQGVNLRAAASATAKIKQALPGGVTLTVLDCQGAPYWKHVAYKGAQGFVSARYTATARN